jgi:WD40 repeat protein
MLRSCARAIIVLGLLAAALGGSSAAARGERPAPIPGKKYALLVGINDYDSPELAPLRYAENDVKDLAEVLEKQYGFDAVNVWVMTPGQKRGFHPTRDNLDKRLNLFLQDRKPGDLVLVALSGHGLQWSRERTAYFCPVDAEPGSRDKLLSLDALYDRLQDCGAGVKLVLVDACRDNPLTARARGLTDFEADSITRPPDRAPRTVAVIYSCRPGERALEHPMLRHGVFFHQVIEGLKSGRAAGGGKAVTLGSLFKYVRQPVDDFARNYLSRSQRPVLKFEGEDPEDVVLFPLATPAGETGEGLALRGHRLDVTGLALCPDGARAVSASSDATLRVWDLAAGKELHRRRADGDPWLWSVAVSPRGDAALVGLVDGTVRLWDLTTGAERACPRGHRDQVMSVAFTPDGGRAVSGGSDNTVRLWDLKTGKELRRFTGHTQSVCSVACAPDGRSILSGSWDRTVRVWDPATGRQRHLLAGHEQMVHGVAFSPNGRLAASDSSDGTIRIWNVVLGEEVAVLRDAPAAYRAVAFTPDGRHVVSGSEDHLVRVWDVGEGRLVHTFVGHRGPVLCLAISADGRRLLSGSARTEADEAEARLWRLP